MKGTAILFGSDQTITIFEDIERTELEEICKAENKNTDHTYVLWYEGEIDWDYGY